MRKWAVLLFLPFVFSCSKEEATPENPHQDQPYIAEILSVRVANATTDSAWIHLDTIEKSFSPSINGFEYSMFLETKDSLSLRLDAAGSLYFKNSLLLPPIMINDLTWLSLNSDSLRIDAFKTTIGFQSNTHWDVSQTTSGVISKYQLTGKYRRIYYNADIKVKVKDSRGWVWTLHGALKGSKFTEPFSSITVW